MSSLKSAIILQLLVYLASMDLRSAVWAFNIKHLEMKMEQMGRHMEGPPYYVSLAESNAIQAEFKKFADYVRSETSEALKIINMTKNSNVGIYFDFTSPKKKH